MTKKLLFAIVVTLVLISCSQQEELTLVPSVQDGKNHVISLEEALVSANAFFNDVQEIEKTRANVRILKSVELLG